MLYFYGLFIYRLIRISVVIVIAIAEVFVRNVETQCESEMIIGSTAMSSVLRVVRIREGPFSTTFLIRYELFQLNRKWRRRSGKKSRPITKHYFAVLQVRETGRFFLFLEILLIFYVNLTLSKHRLDDGLGEIYRF